MNAKAKIKFVCAVAAASVCAVLAGGCATHTSLSGGMRAAWQAGDAAGAERAASGLADDSSSADKLVWLLEKGATARAAADFPASIAAFSEAYELVKKYEAEPGTRLSEQAEAFLANQSYMPYKGYHYDKTMLCVYQALNRVETGDFDGAAVELRRLSNFQSEAKAGNIGRIEARERALLQANEKSGANGCDVSKTLSSPEARAGLNSIYGDAFANSARAQAAAVYTNPFGYWIAGMFFANAAADAADRETAAAMFRLCAESLGGKSALANADAARAERLANGQAEAFGNATYIIFETGSAPIRKQVRLDLPLFLVAKHVPHVAVNFPYLSECKSHRESVSVAAGAQAAKFETFADIDAAVRGEFNAELPCTITKMVLAAAAKATAQYFASKAAGKYGIIVDIGMGAYQSFFNDADLRTWLTLPKFVKVARLETPADGVVLVEGKPVKVAASGVNVVLVKSMSASGAVIVRNFNFQKNKQKQQTKNSI